MNISKTKKVLLILVICVVVCTGCLTANTTGAEEPNSTKGEGSWIIKPRGSLLITDGEFIVVEYYDYLDDYRSWPVNYSPEDSCLFHNYGTRSMFVEKIN
jgi:hypothetical protein